FASSLASACSLLLSIAFVVILAIPHYRSFICQNYLHTFIYRLASRGQWIVFLPEKPQLRQEISASKIPGSPMAS
ncbi:hypothetical protein, partial [Undibacterium sp. TC9W]|uniref:hypothetical protein n=1 Tax=Undibacterium sp. TC9W TaxID=3413053 RepID=UPI003BF1E6E8